MKSRLIVWRFALVAVAAVALLSAPAAPQNRTPSREAVCCSTNEDLQKFYLGLAEAKKPTPRSPDGHPDLTGFYNNPFPNSGQTKADGTVEFRFQGKRNPNGPRYNWPEPNQPPYKPEYAAKVEAIFNSQYGATTRDDPEYQCKPMGVPRASMTPLQFVQTPKMVVILYESNFIGQTYRIIYTDGRPHPKDLDSSFMGHSIGHWEGDTLVVDVAGLNDQTWYAGGTGGGTKHSTIHSDKEHVIERWTRKGNEILYEATVEDPVMLEQPWVITPKRVQLAAPSDFLLQFHCITEDKGHIVQPTDKDQYK